MNNLREIINQFKENNNEEILSEFKFLHNGKTGYGESFDLNYWNRKDLVFELLEQFDSEHRTLLKWLINEELKGFEVDLPTYLIELSVFMLYKYMELEDVYKIYESKFGAGSDHQAIIDIEFVFGLGQEETKEFLLTEPKNKALNKEILETIKRYEENPNAKFKTRTEYLTFFETIKLKNIKEDVLDFEEALRK